MHMQKSLQQSLQLLAWVVFIVLAITWVQPLQASNTHSFGDDEGEDDGGYGESDDTIADNSTTADVEVLGPFGGNIWDIAIDSERNMIYGTAKDSPNGVYRSDDGGETWQGLAGVDLGGGFAVEVSEDTGAVFALFSNGLYKSTDLGETFTKITTDFGGAITFSNGTLFMANTDEQAPGTVFMSEDEGTTWTESTIDDSLYVILWMTSSPTSGQTYVVGFDSADLAHAYVTNNDGVSWTELTIPSIEDNSWGSQLVVNPTDANHLVLTGSFSGTSYQSTNAGDSWTSITPQSTAAAFNSEGRLYIGGMYSDDSGGTWEELGKDENDNNTAIGGHVLAIDPSNEEVIYADGMPGISKSTDGGATWDDINEGIAGVTITDVSQAADKDIVWAAAYNGVAKTENFTEESPAWTFPILPDPATAIWVQSDNPDMVVVGEIGAMKRTEDGGETWSDNLVDGLMSTDYSVSQLVNDVDDPNILYAAVANGEPNNAKIGMVLQSTDLGETWTDMEIIDDASAQAIAQASDGTLYVGVGAEAGTDLVAGVYKYSNATWEFLENSPAEEIVSIEVDPNDDNVVYAVASQAYGNNNTGNFGFYRSENAGETWTKITDGIESNREYNSLAIQASTNPTTLYLGAVSYNGQGILYKSSDAGTTWNTLFIGLKEETYYTLLFDGVTAGTSRGLFEIKSKSGISLKLKKAKIMVGKKGVLMVTLKDAVTNKRLSHKKIQILKKRGSSFKKIRTATTKNNGKVSVKIRQAKAGNNKYKVKWVPKNLDAEEYLLSTSNVKKLTAKKAKRKHNN